MRIAIIDMGTNTFNLLIVEANNDKGYIVIFKSKSGVKLGKGGIKAILEVDLNEDEKQLLKGSAEHVKAVMEVFDNL